MAKIALRLPAWTSAGLLSERGLEVKIQMCGINVEIFYPLWDCDKAAVVQLSYYIKMEWDWGGGHKAERDLFSHVTP